jgi:phosphoribosylformimino-5-aminoimidazole carboxamide ribotide isomerase
VNIIPAIDLQDGKCVRLFQGDFSKTTEYSDDPSAIARQFSDLSASVLHVVDLDGARSGTQTNRSIIAAIASQSQLAVQLGGGIRSRETLLDWFDVGVSRCVIGSLAITEPDTIKSWLMEFGPDRLVLALDVNIDDENIPLITTHGWTRPSGVTLFDCIDDYQSADLLHVLCTDVSRDGAMVGPNFELYADLLARYPDLQLQASGGVRNIEDLRELRRIGVPAAISGRALLEGNISSAEVASFQQDA